MKKDLWIEGTFAGEVTVEGNLARELGDDDAYDDIWDDLEDAWDEDEWYGDDVDAAIRGDDCERANDTSTRDRKRNMHNKDIGRRGEQAAARYLDHIGYEILERNFSCPFGEADIIARDGDTLTFVEVKTRTGVAKGFPSEAVDARKRSRYERIAGWYLRDYEVTNIPVRFDVIAIMVVSEDRAFLRHYCNAFGCGM